MSSSEGLLTELASIQSLEACVGQAAVVNIASRLSLPVGQVDGVASFYSMLSRTPRGRYDVLLSNCVSDRLKGGERRLRQLSTAIGISPGETRDDGRVSLHETSCTGMCDQAPSGLINGLPVTRLTPARIREIAGLIETGVPIEEWPKQLFMVDTRIRRRDLILNSQQRPGDALSKLTSQGPESVLSEVEKSGLRGRGGAGFATGMKWRFCRDAPGDHYVLCNADEGEPGTFKDRVLLEEFPDLVLEGMTLCGLVTGARQGIIYLRGEYRFMAARLESALERWRSEGRLGHRILGDPALSFDIEVYLGAGAYVCGEESALIESLEGKRGIPRIRPPFPVTHGYRGQPTVVNNVETFAAAAAIVANGPDWFRSCGTERSPGTKLLSVSGDCAAPGIYEYPLGTALRDVLAACGAEEPAAVQLSGPAGLTASPRDYQRGIAYEDLPAGGAVMVLGRNRDLLDMVASHAAFFAHESCGFCTPCRVGSAVLRDLLAEVRAGRGGLETVERLRRTAGVMKASSHCGLGQSAPNSIVDTLDRFPELYEQRGVRR